MKHAAALLLALAIFAAGCSGTDDDQTPAAPATETSIGSEELDDQADQATEGEATTTTAPPNPYEGVETELETFYIDSGWWVWQDETDGDATWFRFYTDGTYQIGLSGGRGLYEENGRWSYARDGAAVTLYNSDRGYIDNTIDYTIATGDPTAIAEAWLTLDGWRGLNPLTLRFVDGVNGSLKDAQYQWLGEELADQAGDVADPITRLTIAYQLGGQVCTIGGDLNATIADLWSNGPRPEDTGGVDLDKDTFTALAIAGVFLVCPEQTDQ